MMVQLASGNFMDQTVLVNKVQAGSAHVQHQAALRVVAAHYNPCAASRAVCQNGGECTSFLDIVADDVIYADSPEVGTYVYFVRVIGWALDPWNSITAWSSVGNLCRWWSCMWYKCRHKSFCFSFFVLFAQFSTF